jgi:hypothetical protein
MHWWMSARQILQYCTVELAWKKNYRFFSTGLSIGHQICPSQVSSISLFLLSILPYRQGAVTWVSIKAFYRNCFRGTVICRQKKEVRESWRSEMFVMYLLYMNYVCLWNRCKYRKQGSYGRFRKESLTQVTADTRVTRVMAVFITEQKLSFEC